MAEYFVCDTTEVSFGPEPAARSGVYSRRLKRGLDLLLVLLAAPFVVPLVFFLAFLVRRDGGPAFYCQDRIGWDGRVFRIWKLRSMVPDADALLAAHLEAHPEARDEWDRTQKLRDDPRITPVGRLIRKTSLDELPQLWNVLRGDMSLVGPRPVTEAEIDRYGVGAVDYMTLRPGLTGPWQVDGRNDISYDDRVAMDVAYARDHDLRRDFGIVLRTGFSVLKLTGR